MPAVSDIIARPLRTAQGALATGLALAVEGQSSPVNRTGGDQGAGLIQGVALCTVGEALGHDRWCDLVMLQQIADLGNAKGNGVKARFTHPGLSSDGLGTFLGRVKNLAVSGEVVRGDLHFDASAAKSPEGNLAEYVMDLAENDPSAFGSSVVFTYDMQAMTQFELANGATWQPDDEGCMCLVGFQSPDPRNVSNYPHARLKELRAADIVDEPAANPTGVFQIPSETLDQAEEMAGYVLGVSSVMPQGQLAEQINPERAKAFFARYLNQHGLAIGPAEQFHSTEKPEKPVTTPVKPEVPVITTEQLTAEFNEKVKRFAKFGAKGIEWLSEGLSYEQALEKHAEQLSADLTASQAAEKKAREDLAALDRGEDTPVKTGEGSAGSYASALLKKK